MPAAVAAGPAAVVPSAFVRVQWLFVAVPLALALPGCGGGGSPTSPGTPAPSYPVTAVVFYDENGNGVLDAAESVRLPEVDVEVAGHVGRSEKLTGRAVVNGVPAGSFPVSVRGASLPPFYAATAVPAITVPQAAGSEALRPLTLPIGENPPNTYLAFGDSITIGEGARNSDGYRDILELLLAQNLGGRHRVIGDGISGNKSEQGADRIELSLRRNRAAYLLILYGTNDWNKNKELCTPGMPCATVENLRFMIQVARSVHTLPVVSTIIPANPAYLDRNAPERNEWIASMNELIKTMARQEGAALADSHAAFMKSGNLSSLFVDYVHPNDAGYQLLAGAFFTAIARPPAAAASSAPWPRLFLAPAATSGRP
jgi:acyl-CoA thioesterase I